VKPVQGRKVKHSNCNYSAADCSISLKFGKEFHWVTGDTLQMFKVICQGRRSQRNNVSAAKCFKTATDRWSDFKLVMAS